MKIHTKNYEWTEIMQDSFWRKMTLNEHKKISDNIKDMSYEKIFTW